MSSGSNNLYVIHVETSEETGPLEGEKGDIEFPEKVRGWSDVLDCRHAPYTEMGLKELLHYAGHVHKFYLLVEEDFIRSQAGSALAIEELEQEA